MNLTTNGGLQLFNCLWDTVYTSKIIDKLQIKNSGDPMSSIVKNLVIGKLIEAKSLSELCDKTIKEYFLSSNSKSHRTTYSRNMDKVGYYKQNTILNVLVEYVVGHLKLSKHAKKAFQIIDASALQITGETFEDAEWVYDGRIDGLVWGYEVLTQIIQIAGYSFPVSFRVNDMGKDKMVSMFEMGRRKFGIDRLLFDGGIKGMHFYKELDCRDFKFYTKATMNWHWDFNFFDKTTEELAEIAKCYFRRNHKYVDFSVKKKIDSGQYAGQTMDLRLIFVKGDKRVFLTNDFDSSIKQVYQFYKLRWKIEEMFKEEKENLGFEHLTVRKRNAIRTHIMCVFLAFIFAQLMLKRFPSIKGIRLLVRYVISNIAQLVQTTTGIVIKFLQDFRYRFALERAIG